MTGRFPDTKLENPTPAMQHLRRLPHLIQEAFTRSR